MPKKSQAKSPASLRVPADLRQELAKSKAVAAKFVTLPASHKLEYIQWIEEAKSRKRGKNGLKAPSSG